MPLFTTLATLLPPAAKLGASLLSKPKRPKREDFGVNTDFIRRFIANLRSQKSSSNVQELLLQPELRRIGSESSQAVRDIEANFNRVGAPEGAFAEARTGVARTTISAISDATSKARAAQLTENRRIQDRIERAILQQGGIEAQGDLAFDRANTAFDENNRIRNLQLIGGFADVAGAGAGLIASDQATKLATDQAATAVETIGNKELTNAEIVQMIRSKEITPGAGLSIAGSLAKGASAIAQSRQKSLNKFESEFSETFIQENLPGFLETIKDLDPDTDLPGGITSGTLDPDKLERFFGDRRSTLDAESLVSAGKGDINAPELMERLEKGLLTPKGFKAAFKNLTDSQGTPESRFLSEGAQLVDTPDKLAKFLDDALESGAKFELKDFNFLNARLKESKESKPAFAGDVIEAKSLLRFNKLENTGIFEVIKKAQTSGTFTEADFESALKLLESEVKNLDTGRKVLSFSAGKLISSDDSTVLFDDLSRILRRMFNNSLSLGDLNKKAEQN